MVSCNPPAPGCVQLEMIFNCNGQLAENVFHLKKGDGSTPTHAEMTTLALNAATNFANGPWSYTNGGNCFVKAQVRDISAGPGGDVVVDTTHAGNCGTSGGLVLPNNVALAISLHTALGGRSGRGRIYLMGLSGNVVSAPNAITNTTAGLMRDALNAWMGQVTGGTTYSFGVLSKWHNKACRAAAVFNAITSVSVDTTTDSQRRRLPGRGK